MNGIGTMSKWFVCILPQCAVAAADSASTVRLYIHAIQCSAEMSSISLPTISCLVKRRFHFHSPDPTHATS